MQDDKFLHVGVKSLRLDFRVKQLGILYSAVSSIQSSELPDHKCDVHYANLWGALKATVTNHCDNGYRKHRTRRKITMYRITTDPKAQFTSKTLIIKQREEKAVKSFLNHMVQTS